MITHAIPQHPNRKRPKIAPASAGYGKGWSAWARSLFNRFYQHAAPDQGGWQTKGWAWRMTQFLGSHQNRIDAKGRVSVPAPFRAFLKPAANGAPNGTTDGDMLPTLILRPSHKHPCIEGWPGAVFAALSRPLETHDLFSESHDDFAAALYADAFATEPDKEGRIILPDWLSAHANLTDSVVFMGLGRTFQIWEPEAAERRRAEARQRTRERGLTLPAQAPAHAPMAAGVSA
jgi:MraZ protein